MLSTELITRVEPKRLWNSKESDLKRNKNIKMKANYS